MNKPISCCLCLVQCIVLCSGKNSKRLGKNIKENKRKTKENKKKSFQEKQRKSKYSSSSRNLRDIYSRPSGGLEDVLFLLDNTCNNIQTHKKLRDKHKQQKQHKYIISQPEPERYLFAVGSWDGYPVFLFLCFSRNFSVSFCLFYVFA